MASSDSPQIPSSSWFGESVDVKRLQAYFEDVERFKLDVLALMSQQHHHQFEVSLVSDVSSHDVEIGSI